MAEFANTPIPYVPIGTQAAAVRTAIDAPQLSAANSFGGLQKLAIPGPFATDVEANTNGVPDDNLYYRSDGTVRAASHLSLDLAFALDKTLTARIGPTPTFERASGGTYVGSDNLIHGIDTSASSNSISIASKTFTLDAPLGQDQMWRVGDVVQVSNGINTMSGTVTSYTASTQVLVCDITSVSGTGTFTSWRVAYRGPRFDHDPSTGQCKGLLIEESRSNLLTRSEEFETTWVPSNTTVLPNQTVSPNGQTTADKLVEVASLSQHFISQQTTKAASSITYAFSVYYKNASGTRNLILAITNGTSAGRGAIFTTSGSVAAANISVGSGIGFTIISAVVENAGGGWYRASITVSSDTSTRLDGVIYLSNSSSSITVYDGDGTSGIFLWGAQLEAGAFPTSYIPTAATVPVVRSADVCSITGTDFSGFYNQMEGTLFAGVTAARGYGSLLQYVYGISASTGSELLAAYRESSRDIRVATLVTSVNQTPSLNGGNLADASSSKIAVASQQGNFAISQNGSISTTSIGLMPSVDRLFIGDRVGSDRSWNGHIASIRYYKKRLSNAKLQSLTAP